MSFLSRLRTYHLSITHSVLIAGIFISLSILYSANLLRGNIHWNGVREYDVLNKQNSYLYYINESIKKAGEKAITPVTLDKQTFDTAFTLCMNASTSGNPDLPDEYNTARQKHCLNKILKTDIE